MSGSSGTCGTSAMAEYVEEEAPLAEPFRFLVRQQAKSIVAIQELQQDVGDLLLFRQMVLAALPHLQSKSALTELTTTNAISVAAAAVAASGKLYNPANTWTRKRHQQQQQYRSYELQNAVQTVADSGFSTEANSNSSPRSSRVETQQPQQQLETPAAPKTSSPVDKDISQQLERVRSRISRLRKDEERLSALLNPELLTQQQQQGEEDSGDELWKLLEQIESRGREIRSQMDRFQSAQEDTMVPAAAKIKNFCEEISKKEPGTSPVVRDIQRGSIAAMGKKVGFQMKEGVGLISEAASAVKYVRPSRERISAVLKTTNPVHLQKQAIYTILENEALREQLKRTQQHEAAREQSWQNTLQENAEQLAQLKEENEDLRFQLMEQSIELEGTKARLRLVSRSPPPPPPDYRSSFAQTEYNKVNGCTQTERLLPRVIDTASKGRAISTAQDICSSWEDEDKPSVERRSFSSRIPTPIRPASLTTASSTAAAKTNAKRELPPVPGQNEKSRTLATKPRPTGRSRDATDTKVIVLTSTPVPSKNRVGLVDPFASGKRLGKSDDYYDSINDSRYESSIKSDYLSPMDSLERSLPSMGINYHCEINGNRSYSSSSITPSNSLSLNE